jgi:predicted NUDIX family NTP pyrophosphohydrolase
MRLFIQSIADTRLASPRLIPDHRSRLYTHIHPDAIAMKQSAGTLLYRHRDGRLEVLLVHGSGNYNRHKPWSIPKGEPDDGEPLEAAARRETFEETGVTPGELFPVGEITYQKSRKRVHGFAGPAPEDAAPSCASWEVDCAEFVEIARARELLHPDQLPLLEQLERQLSGSG